MCTSASFGPTASRSRCRGMSEEIKREGPGAATAEAPKEIPLIEVDGHGGHTLEPDYKRLPIGPDHIPDDDTHPFFPDHFWPYPIIAIVMLIAVGLLSAYVQKNLQLEASADPRAVTIPRPDWYFLFLFQFLKLGNEFVFSIVIGTVVIILLLIFPFLDSMIGPRVAKRLGWKKWPVPGRNIITGSIFVGALVIIALLELWALAGPMFCLPWFVNSPVFGA